MSVWDDMAHDGGYRGDQARQVAAMLEQEERDREERPDPTVEELCEAGGHVRYLEADRCYCGAVGPGRGGR